jgi:hypothetical protein
VNWQDVAFPSDEREVVSYARREVWGC